MPQKLPRNRAARAQAEKRRYADLLVGHIATWIEMGEAIRAAKADPDPSRWTGVQRELDARILTLPPDRLLQLTLDAFETRVAEGPDIHASAVILSSAIFTASRGHTLGWTDDELRQVVAATCAHPQAFVREFGMLMANELPLVDGE